MKKIKLEFRKEVISTLNESELARIQGGNTAFSYNSCPTVDGPCTATSECTDQDSWQGGSRNTDPVLDHAMDKHPSDYCLLVSDDDH